MNGVLWRNLLFKHWELLEPNDVFCFVCFFFQVMAGGIKRDTTEIETSVVFKVEPREKEVWETWSSMGFMMRG